MTRLVIIVLFLTGVLAIIKWQGVSYEKFDSGAKKVTGKVVRKEERKLRPNQPAHKENWLVYSYEVNGKSFTGEDKVEFTDLWTGYKVGGDVDVSYNGERPQESHPSLVFDRRIAATRKIP